MIFGIYQGNWYKSPVNSIYEIIVIKEFKHSRKVASILSLSI